MSGITEFTTRGVPLNQNNIDTDQVIPARFLKVTTKVGLGENLFRDLRYNSDDSEKLDFPLNMDKYKSGKILVAPHNFGCGSSREHAPWALVDYGFQAVIAISFADIFNNNSLKNGLLPITLPETVVLKLIADIEADPTLEITIDLPNQNVSVPNQGDFKFDVEPFRKTCLMEGLDDIGYTMKQLEHITRYEETLV